MVKAAKAGNRRKAAANAKIVSEIYGAPCFTVFAR
jgi:hypothetical protein